MARGGRSARGKVGFICLSCQKFFKPRLKRDYFLFNINMPQNITFHNRRTIITFI